MSSDDVAISVRNLTKAYRMFSHPGDRLKQAMMFGLRKYHEAFTALEDVSFDVRKGETVGIIGRNGSGKSTLLQLICGILKPTSGSTKVRGRVAALLELGAGFNPEFTGRENVYFQGALMGFTRRQMDERFEAISAFAEIGDFIDQPVRMYSSGMFLRLAFATGIHVSPDILVIDEALAVGDEAFQERCFQRLNMFRESGGTVLFVSHNTNMVASYCDRVILLDKGKLILHTEPGPAVTAYNGITDKTARHGKALSQSVSGKGEMLVDMHFVTTAGDRTDVVMHGQTYELIFDTEFQMAAHDVAAMAKIRLRNGFVLGTFTSVASSVCVDVRKGQIVRFRLPFQCLLLPGTYVLECSIEGENEQSRHCLIRAKEILMEVVAEHALPPIGAVSFTPLPSDSKAH